MAAIDPGSNGRALEAPFAAAHQGATLALFGTTLLLGAFLLFWVQPLFTRMVLPMLGGSPAVWNTAMVFFQGALLAGYAYAHAIARWLEPRRQMLVHLALLATASLTLPITVGQGWVPPEGWPVSWLIALLACSLGLPFIAVAATAPLLQRWFAASGHPAGGDPYFLYGASNTGSILAALRPGRAPPKAPSISTFGMPTRSSAACQRSPPTTAAIRSAATSGSTSAPAPISLIACSSR